LKNLKYLYLIVVIILGCAPKVDFSPKLSEKNLSRIVLLPSVGSEDISSSRVNFLEEHLRNELTNKGYLLVDPLNTQQVCNKYPCDRMNELFEEYGVDAVVVFMIDEFAKSDFGIAYYNSLGGKLLFLDGTVDPLVKIEYQESERGGLLFDSGQVFKGLQDQFDNTVKDQAFSLLAERFIKHLAEKVPQAAIVPTEAKRDLKLNRVKVRSVEKGKVEICMLGTPGMQAFLKTESSSTNLREVKSGFYCGRFLKYGLLNGVVELRDPFGLAVESEINVAPSFQCKLKISEPNQDNKNAIPVVDNNCLQLGVMEKKGLKCKQLVDCSDSKIYLYGASQRVGPFQKIAKYGVKGWQLENASDIYKNYQVVVVDRFGFGHLIKPVANKAKKVW